MDSVTKFMEMLPEPYSLSYSKDVKDLHLCLAKTDPKQIHWAKTWTTGSLNEKDCLYLSSDFDACHMFDIPLFPEEYIEKVTLFVSAQGKDTAYKVVCPKGSRFSLYDTPFPFFIHNALGAKIYIQVSFGKRIVASEHIRSLLYEAYIFHNTARREIIDLDGGHCMILPKQLSGESMEKELLKTTFCPTCVSPTVESVKQKEGIESRCKNNHVWRYNF